MSSAKKRPSLANLPGQQLDRTPRIRRAELLEQHGSYSYEAMVPEQLNLDKDTIHAEASALASFVIEQFWDYIKTQRVDGTHLTQKLDSYPSGINTVAKEFVVALNARLAELQTQFADSIFEQDDGKSAEEIPQDHILVHRFLLLMETQYGHVGLPSMKDLVALIERVAGVTDTVFEREIGRLPSAEEARIAISHPSMKRLFMEIMTNNNDIALPLIGVLDGGQAKDYSALDAYTEEFQSELFEMKTTTDGKRIIMIRPDVVFAYREACAAEAEKRAANNEAEPKALQCPVLYTGKFIEMYDWVVDEYIAFSAPDDTKQ